MNSGGSEFMLEFSVSSGVEILGLVYIYLFIFPIWDVQLGQLVWPSNSLKKDEYFTITTSKNLLQSDIDILTINKGFLIT